MTKLAHVIDTHIKINAPIEVVWQMLIDYAGYENWNPYLVKIVGEAIAGTTTQVHSVFTPDAKPIIALVSITSIEPYTMRWEGGLPDRDKFKGDHWFILAEEADGTFFRHFEHFSGVLAATIFEKHGKTIEGNFAIFNNALKAEAERCFSNLSCT